MPTWLTFGAPAGAAALSTVFGRRSFYRQHPIQTKLLPGGAVATVYSGEDPIYRAYDVNEIEALLRAQQWIDERDEYAPEYDLHTELQDAA